MRKLTLTGRLLFAITLLISLSACGPQISYYAKLNKYLLNQDYDAALAEHRRNQKNYASKDKALYYLDEGLLAHFAGRYEESNASLLRAETIMSNLYTRSVSREAASLLINDNTIAYRGEDFEAALVNLFLSLNFFQLGQPEEALVEARKVDSKLNSFNLQYAPGQKNVYKEDAFIRYLMGVMYMAEKEVNDAFISFRKAEHIYRKDYRSNYGIQPPALLIEDLLQSAKEMEFKDEYRRYGKRYSEIEKKITKPNPNQARVHFIHFNGRGAKKIERYLFVPMPDKYVVKLAYPEFQEQKSSIKRFRILLTDTESKKNFQISSQLMEDISAIAKLNLKNRMGRITAKAVARVTAKYLLAKEAEKKAEKEGDKNLAKILRFTSQTYMVASEIADIRHWRLLPAEIQVGRSQLPAGDYEGTIFFLNSSGQTVTTRPLAPFSVSAGETKLVTFQTLE